MTGTVNVTRPVLEWAIARSGESLERLRDRFPHVLEWISGEGKPTLRQIENLAQFTKTPLGFFFLDRPPEEQLPVPYFRTRGDARPPAPSPNLVQSVYAMQLRQAWAREYLAEAGAERVSIVRSADPRERTAAVAERIRENLGLRPGWASRWRTWTSALRHLRSAMDSSGILVVVNGVVGNNTYRALSPDEFRGFVLVDDYAPLVFVNGADAKAAQMFTLAHELAHLAFGLSAAFDLYRMQSARRPTEQTCNRVAAEFLVPEQELRNLSPDLRDVSTGLETIARHFKVSRLVAARRAFDLGLIDRKTFFTCYETELRYYNSDNSESDGGDFWNTQNSRVGRRFGAMVVSAAAEGRLPYSEAYRLTGLYGATFTTFASKVTGGAR